jgi:hypothetical protein
MGGASQQQNNIDANGRVIKQDQPGLARYEWDKYKNQTALSAVKPVMNVIEDMPLSKSIIGAADSFSGGAGLAAVAENIPGIGGYKKNQAAIEASNSNSTSGSVGNAVKEVTIL